MSFEPEPRIIAVAPELIDSLFPALLDLFGEEVLDGDRQIRTFGAFWDDAEQTRIRAASMIDGTIVGTPLTDGRRGRH